MAILDLVKWDAQSDSSVVWKCPSQELSTWTQLIVNESQEAFLVRGGVYEGPFGAGRHTLSTENVPVIRSLFGLPFGGRSPFTAEVWYVNKATNLNVKWGTPDPIQLQDPKFGIMVSVRSFGQYGIRIENSKLFLNKIVGTLPSFGAEEISRYLSGELIKRIKGELARAVSNERLSILEVNANIETISEKVRQSMLPHAQEYGVTIPQFSIHSINVPEDDAGVTKLREALAKRAEMSILGFDYQQQRSLDILQAAASNEGTAGSLMGAGLGAGMGVNIGGGMGREFAKIVPSMETAQAPTQPRLSMEDKIRQIKELSELKNAGILTDEEFAQQKSLILGP
ncbi:SPFH domain-containing protein [Paraburkholderia sp. BL6669N2]|uniref:SPFH domain-containing protein n=1 Tax=Paraburkholderia sp. BL6669N2 TaxID=1938807 RepID=UPI0015F255E3|nr:SPFH domain-containing protein [Paraburkholderia sp. BL6669N2]